jgi:hypothetical protein
MPGPEILEGCSSVSRRADGGIDISLDPTSFPPKRVPDIIVAIRGMSGAVVELGRVDRVYPG